jgi:hypothetical protein
MSTARVGDQRRPDPIPWEVDGGYEDIDVDRVITPWVRIPR